MYKMNLITGILGMALALGFLGFYIAWVKAVPLIVIILGVIGMMIYDFVQTMRNSNGSNG